MRGPDWGFFLLIMTLPLPVAGQQMLSGRVEMEISAFPEEGAIEGQRRVFPSVAAELQWVHDWSEGTHRIVATGFGRYDPIQGRRSHADLRELYWQGRAERWELAIGARQMFWGVVEASHVVDIVNQIDVLDDPALDTKLGQPMIQLTRVLDGGTADLLFLPYFRQREFPAGRGRFQPPMSIDSDDVRYESSWEEWRPALAARWSQSVSRVDVALSHYWGYDPEPEMLFAVGDTGRTLYHDLIHRTGLEVLVTVDATLLKVEAAYQEAERPRKVVVAGIEHTFGDVGRSGKDLMLFLEYAYDSFGRDVFTGLDDDFFGALQLAWNDVASTEMTVGAIKDRTRSSTIVFARAGSRFSDSWRWELEGKVFGQISDQEFLHAFRNDTYAQLTIAKYF